jgi:hypothetical protein
MDTTLVIKRLLIWGISFALGTVITLAIIFGPMKTDIETYSIRYMVLTIISIAMIFVVWGDLLLGTKILKD